MPQEGRAYLEIQLQLAGQMCDDQAQLRCPAAQPQRRTPGRQQKKPGGKGGMCLMVTAARWAKPAALARSLRGARSQKFFIRDFPRTAPSGGGKAVLMLHNTSAYVTQHNSSVTQHNSHITQRSSCITQHNSYIIQRALGELGKRT